MDSVHVGGLGGTYGGNPVACAAALGAIETMAAEDLAGRARRIGDIMLPRLHKLAEANPVIGDVRGRGAMIAIELVRPGTLEPAPPRRPRWPRPATVLAWSCSPAARSATCCASCRRW